MSLKIFIFLVVDLFFSMVLAADHLPGESYFYIKETTGDVYLLSWKKQNSHPPKPNEKYDRKKHFGVWLDFPHDNTCLTTRGLVLERDTLGPIKVYENKPCFISEGLWYDPYTDAYYDDAKEIEIDHVVPLKQAYIAGAHSWTWKQRCSYFNFLGNRNHLIPIEGKVNSAKLDNGPEEWMPPNVDYHCQYLSNWLRVKAIWKLMLSEIETKTISTINQSLTCDPKLFILYSEELKDLRSKADITAEDCLDAVSHTEGKPID